MRLPVPQLAIVRTAWLFGLPGNDFPARILAAADRGRAAGEPLRVVGDEIGSPTFAQDLAEGIMELLAAGTFAGVHHIVNAGSVSRAGWARHVLHAAGVDVPIVEIPLAIVDAAVDAAGLGRARPDAPADRRAPAAVAGRVRRLPSDPAARPRGGDAPVSRA